MARLSREFVKLETRILNDHRFFTMSEFEQLVFVKLLGISRSTGNKIPKKIGVVSELLRTKRSATEIKSAIKRIKLNFPKFKENKYFWYFDGYELRLDNSIPKSDNNYCVDVDEDKDEDKDSNKTKIKDKFLDFVLLTKEQYQTLLEKLGEQTTKEYIERLNNYIGAKGIKYKSHYHAILTWVKKDKPKETEIKLRRPL